jgi:cytochrome c-type biogenesis protein CcmH/NrfG
MAPSKRPSDAIGLPGPTFEAMLKAAVELYGENKLVEAAELLRALTRLDPNDARAFKMLGSIGMLEHRRERALAAYERAYALDPKDPYTWVALAEIKLDYHEIEAALALCEKLFALDPKGEHPAANRARKLLKDAGAKFKKA